MPSGITDIRTFSKEGRDQLSQETIQPLEGFTESIEKSISEYVGEATSDVDKGRRYLHWILTHIFEATESEAEDAIIDGPNDCGIDARFYLSEKEIILIQAKFGTSHSIEAIDHFEKNVQRFQDSDQTKIKRPDLAYLWNNTHEKGTKIIKYYVTDQDVEYKSDDVQVIGIRQTIQHIAEREKNPTKGQEATIKFVNGYDLDNTFNCAVDAIEIADLVKRVKRIVELNIRNDLGHRSKINKGIMKTLED